MPSTQLSKVSSQFSNGHSVNAPGHTPGFAGVDPTDELVDGGEHDGIEKPNKQSLISSSGPLGQQIRALRRGRGWTQKDLGSMIGVTGAQLHRYETGITPMATGRLTALAEALGVRPDGLAGYTPPASHAVATSMTGARLSDDLLALVEAFTRITDGNSRSAVVAIARILADSSPPVSPDKANLVRQGQ